MWSRHPDRMKANLDAINVLQGCRVEQRVTRLRSIMALLPEHPITPSSMRDHLSEAWLASFSEELPPDKAWNEVRFGLRQGVICRTPDGLYQRRLDK